MDSDDKSELERSIDSYRTKQNRIRYLEIGIGIATGLLKGLPPVIIANIAIVLVLSIGTYDLSINPEYVKDVGTWSLLMLTVLYSVMVVADVLLVPRLTKNTHHSDDELAWVNALRRVTVQGFHSYLGNRPRVRPEQLHWANLDDEGALDRIKHNIEWREIQEITPSVRANMKFHSPLTSEMSELSDACREFADRFDDYSREFIKAASPWDRIITGETGNPSQYMRSAIIGSYLYFSKVVPDETNLGRMRTLWSMNSEIETFLREFIRGDPTNARAISSLKPNRDLERAAETAFEKEKTAVLKLDTVGPAVEEMYRKWSLQYQ